MGLFLLSGCTTTKPSITEYTVKAEVLKTEGSAVGCKDKSLKIAQAFSSSSLMSLKMDYAQSNNKVFSYFEAEWNESPNHFITSQILQNIKDSKLFKSVQVSKSRSKNSWILEINIEDFMQYYSEDYSESNANVVLGLTLIDLKTNEVIATETFNSKVKSKTLDAEGGVEALNSALSNILSQNIEWLNGVCK
jgi:cholesterol transport system auxiliary component